MYLDGEVPDLVVKQVIDTSYKLIFSGLTKHEQLEIIPIKK
jgi:predicted DNA-binding protein (MmcQ/YjbR family)